MRSTVYEIIEINETFARLGFFPPQCKGPTRLQLRSKEISQGERLAPFLHRGDRLGNLFLFARESGSFFSAPFIEVGSPSFLRMQLR